MSWVKIDDQFTDHPKVEAAGPLASWLYVCGLAYSARYLTNGFIPTSRIPRLANIENAQELAEILVSVGMWERAVNGYMVHDYLAYNPSADTVKAEREASKRRMQEMRARRRKASVTPVTPNVTANNSGSYAPVTQPRPRTPIKTSTNVDAPVASDSVTSESATPQESPAKPKRERKYSGEEQAYVGQLLSGVKAIIHVKGQLPSEGKERDAAHWFYRAHDGEPAPVADVLDCYRATKAQPFWAATYLSLQKLEACYTEYRRDPATYKQPRAMPARAQKPTGTDGAGSAYFAKAEDYDPWKD